MDIEPPEVEEIHLDPEKSPLEEPPLSTDDAPGSESAAEQPAASGSPIANGKTEVIVEKEKEAGITELAQKEVVEEE